MTNGVYRQQITHESAWTPASVGGKEGLRFPLGRDALEAIDELLAGTRDKHKHAVTRADFSHPALDPVMDRLRTVVMDGRGLAVVTGIDRSRYDDEAMERIYWGLGTHLGTAVVQSVYGDLMGYVEKAENDPYARAYRSDDELRYHCDTHEFVGLMCVQRAESGGLSRMASTLAIHNELLRSHPELLEPLYEGYWLAPPELQYSSRPVIEPKTPIYCNIDGLVSCTYGGGFVTRAAKVRNEPVPAPLAAAMRAFEEIAARPDVTLEFALEPGEIMYWQNFTNIHARTAFTNSPERKRKLLRIWCKPFVPRRVDPAFHARAEAYFWYYRERAKEGVKALA